MNTPVFIISGGNAKRTTQCHTTSLSNSNTKTASQTTTTTSQPLSSSSHSNTSNRKQRLLSPTCPDTSSTVLSTEAGGNVTEGSHNHKDQYHPYVRAAITLPALNRFLVVLGVKSGRCQGVVSRLLEDIADTLHQHTPIANTTTTTPLPVAAGSSSTPHRGAHSNEDGHSSQSLSTNAPTGSDCRHNHHHHNTTPNTDVNSRGSSLGVIPQPLPIDSTVFEEIGTSHNPPSQQLPLPEISIDQFCALLSNILHTRLKDPFYPRGGCILTPITTPTTTTHIPYNLHKVGGNRGGVMPQQGSWQEEQEDDADAGGGSKHKMGRTPPTTSQHSSPHSPASSYSPSDQRDVVVNEEDSLTRHIRVMGMTLLWGCTPVVVLLAGTSGSGKSTLGSLLAQRLGIHTLIATDAVREQLRHQIRHHETLMTPNNSGDMVNESGLPQSASSSKNGGMRPLFYSTYEAYQGLHTTTPTTHELPAFTAAHTYLHQPPDVECKTKMLGDGGGASATPKQASYNTSLTSVGLTHSSSGGVFSGTSPKGGRHNHFQHVSVTTQVSDAMVPTSQAPLPPTTQQAQSMQGVSSYPHQPLTNSRHNDDTSMNVETHHPKLQCNTPATPEEASSATISGYLAQCSPVQEVLTKTILRLVGSGESVVVEGVHLTPQYMMELADTLNFSTSFTQYKRASDDDTTTSLHSIPSSPTPQAVVCPFLIQIDKSDKHKERFAVRVKSMSLLPNRNNYVKNFKSIREIQEYLLAEVTGPIQRFRHTNSSSGPGLDNNGVSANGNPKGANTSPSISYIDSQTQPPTPYFPICKVRNTNADRSLMRVHGAVVSVISTVRQRMGVSDGDDVPSQKQKVLAALTETMASNSTNINLNSPQTRASSKVAHFQQSANAADNRMLGSDELLKHPPVYRNNDEGTGMYYQHLGSGDLNTAADYDDEEGGGVGSVETNLLSSVQGGGGGGDRVNDSHNSVDSEGKPATTIVSSRTTQRLRTYASFTSIPAVVPRTSSTRVELLSSKEAVSIIFAKNRSKNRRGNRRMRRIDSCGGGSGDGVDVDVLGHLSQQYGQLVTPLESTLIRAPSNATTTTTTIHDTLANTNNVADDVGGGGNTNPTISATTTTVPSASHADLLLKRLRAVGRTATTM